MKVLSIASISFRRVARDRQALFFMIVLPVLIIVLVGTFTARFDSGEVPVGVVNASDEPLAAQLERAITRDASIDATTYGDRDALAKDVRRGVVNAGVVIPADYDDLLASGQPVEVELLIDQAQGAPASRAVVSEVISRQGALVQAASFASRDDRATFGQNLERAEQIARTNRSTELGVRTEVVGEVDETEGSIGTGIDAQPSRNLVIFVFISSLASAAVLIDARRLGITRRMLGTPTSSTTILAGITLGRFAVAAGQAVIIYIIGLLFGVPWGSPLGAIVLIAIWVLLSTGVGMLFGTILRNPEQSSAIGPPVGIALGMLGGCMWPLEIVPDTMRQIGHIFPHAWAMDAWNDLTVRQLSITGIGTELLVLTGFLVVIFPFAIWRLQRSIVAG